MQGIDEVHQIAPPWLGDGGVPTPIQHFPGRRIEDKSISIQISSLMGCRIEAWSDPGRRRLVKRTKFHPCYLQSRIPHLNQLSAKYGDDLLIIGLNVGGEEDRAKIPRFLETTRIDYPIAFPDSDLTQFVFATQSDIPQTAIFDRKGALVRKIVGFNSAIQVELDAAIEQAVRSQ